ncbi:ABC transporter permease [Puia dinghuensis]|uniref:ABC transporter permease n=1 Tax=Puia dinghuensis TaxID=1792502 RepID=A0A8J2UEH5_9BACT|nr:ABC transporter permease [Puia dinghuensis]GGB05545.1 ABC transporter permease [Puia dinghuensis]
MSKIWLITRREYLTRLRNRTFLLSTFLFPLVIVLFIVGMVAIATQTHTRHRIAVIDANGYFKDYLKSDSTISFVFSPDLDTLNYESKGCSAVLIIPVLPEDKKTIYRLKYKKQLGLEGSGDLTNRVNEAITDHLIYEKTAVSRAQLDSIRRGSDIADFRSYEDMGTTAKASNQGASFFVAYMSGILIYILTFVYGAMVMRGVMEEKTNRIAEVVVSSVKPFQLMMGKITGIGAVGLTQFLLWIVLLVSLGIIAQGFIPASTWKDVQDMQHASAMGDASSVAKTSELAQRVYRIDNAINGANIPLTIFCFLFYFIGGYLFYSALFAAVGSAVNEDPQEAQSLMMPITLPVVFSFFIMTVAVQDPGGPLAVWASIIPFSSPIVMMARIPFGVPGTVAWWQLGLSMALLVLGFLGTTWLAGKIYRTGILMYGKKATWKTMWKWAFHK